jgi:Transposase IS66 family
MKRERAKLSGNNPVAKALNYMLRRVDVFTRFLHDGRICLSNNAAERALRGIALGRKAWLFAGSDRGGERAAIILTLIQTGQAQRRRPASLARRRAGTHRGSQDQRPRRVTAMELAPHPDRARRLTKPARLTAAHLTKLVAAIPSIGACPTFARMIRAPSATGAPRGPQRMLTSRDTETNS